MRKTLLSLLLAVACTACGQTKKAEVKPLVINTPNGKIAAILTTPARTQQVPMVVLCHGFMNSKDGELMHTLADSLCAHGIASIRFDFNGHGSSYGQQSEMTVPREIEDAKAIVAHAAKLPFVSRIAIVGHSQGGVVTAMTAGQLGADRIAAIALLSPAAALRDDALRGNLFGTPYDAQNPPETLTIMGGAYTVGRDYIRTAQDLPIYETAREYKGTALIIHGKADDIVPYTYGQRFHYVIDGSRFDLLEGEDHMYTHHESLPAHLVAEFMEEVLK
ncbi:MAG: alpha/beta fold hydrolase [Paludibacteraceae bacterium]|nr:alpha/beta fold hydrolase [Paludibacteraceae bacterium]MBR0195828.1 alpha/beta fold hydrolase [Paludibacteraceae bacterium]